MIILHYKHSQNIPFGVVFSISFVFAVYYLINGNIAPFMAFLPVSITLFSLFASIYFFTFRKTVRFDNEYITFEEFMLKYRYKGKQAKTKDIEEWYVKYFDEGNGEALHIVLANKNILIIRNTEYTSFSALLDYLNSHQIYKRKKSSYGKIT